MATAPTIDEQSTAQAVGRQLERVRTLRRELEAAVLPLHPALVRFGARVAEEGGSDVPTTWAVPR